MPPIINLIFTSVMLNSDFFSNCKPGVVGNINKRTGDWGGTIFPKLNPLGPVYSAEYAYCHLKPPCLQNLTCVRVVV